VTMNTIANSEVIAVRLQKICTAPSVAIRAGYTRNIGSALRFGHVMDATVATCSHLDLRFVPMTWT
jgi:hypothetical protein